MVQEKRNGKGHLVKLGCVAAAATWGLSSAISFVSGGAGARTAPRSERTQLNGYRLDWMLENMFGGKNGDGQNNLQTQDGYWVGERGFEKALGSMGIRYRLRATSDEVKNGIEIDNQIYQFGPVKIRFGEILGGTGNNPKLRELKRKIGKMTLDPIKQAENEYWIDRYGHKRWWLYYVDQSQGTSKQFFRGLAAWSGFDPKKEEKGVSWFEADYGKPWLKAYKDVHLPAISAGQIEKENNSGKVAEAAARKRAAGYDPRPAAKKLNWDGGATGMPTDKLPPPFMGGKK
eukprot:TRINITY_DN1093_c0_g1_i2.p2 TRINITY_DN1093_c0_g1~~TRINITY_DN1093_c0_g1_i2.p2  ORF type:complete len:288 (+),score=93.10 TRINITY_DN1093_c0_g1_i2:95-958(+)